MAEPLSPNTSIANPSTPLITDIRDQQNAPPILLPQTCSSKNCIHKPTHKTDEVEHKKSKKKKKQKKVESDSDSTDSEHSTSSSDPSESGKDCSDDDSSSEDESEHRKDKKNKSKAKKIMRKVKGDKDKTKSSRSRSRTSKQVKYDIDDDSPSSRDSSVDKSSSDGFDSLKKELESKGLLNSSKKGAHILKELLKMASRKSHDDDSKSTKSKKSEHSSKSQKIKSDKKSKKVKEKELSKAKFKRLDEIWDEDLYDYRLKETNDKKKTDLWEKYIFTVRRKFDVENHYQSTVVDIKSVPLTECLRIVMEGVPGISLVEKTPRIMPDMLFLYLEDFRDYLGILTQEIKKCEDKKIKKALKTKAKHLGVLIEYLDKDYDEMKKTLYPMLNNGTITFDLLWALYKPNTLMYRATYADESQPRAFRLDYATKERNYVKGLYYDVEGKYFDYDGENFGWAFIDAEVYQFQGARKITSLACYPLKYCQNQDALKAKLVDRGKKFLSLAGMNYRACKGFCYVKKDNKVLKVNTNGRIMIDPKTFRRINPNYLLSEVEARDVEDENEACRCEKQDQPRKPKLFQDRLFMINKVDDKVVEVIEMSSMDARAPDNLSDSVKRAEAAKLTFTEEEMLVANPLLLGFSFSERLWVELPVSAISDIQWNEGAFDSLVIPEKHKSIVKALVSAHGMHSTKSIDDVVSGKGKGLVAVLHGKPGLGKTLTCEAVADLLKRPLYSVSAGDLGTSATNLEFHLQSILDVAHTWDAVLLLDEADVFLEARSTHDLSRNALVAIFLRSLEYFQGILMMTTNRVETFDEAFVSRIHLSLRYGDLTIQARKAIWKTFITKVAESATTVASAAAPTPSTATSDTSSTGVPTPDTTSSTPNSGAATPVPSTDSSATPPVTPITSTSSLSINSIDSDKTVTLSQPATTTPGSSTPTVTVEKITEANYIELSRVDLNGRQIKNLVKTAQALALYENVPMGMGHLRRCIEVGRSFELDLKGGRGWEDVMRSYT